MSCSTKNQCFTRNNEYHPIIKIDLPALKPVNNGYMSYVFRSFHWNKKQVADDAQMEKDFLAIFESQIGVYPYWFADSEGITLVAAFPNPIVEERRRKSTVTVGLTELDEAAAEKAATATVTSVDQDTAFVAISRLYDSGYILCRKTDVQGQP